MPRKKPFSGKAKKEQLKLKRIREFNRNFSTITNNSSISIEHQQDRNIVSLNAQPSHSTNQLESNKLNQRNRFNLQFEKESKVEIENRKISAQQPIIYMNEIDKEVSITDIYPIVDNIDVFKRPHWDYTMTKEDLEQKEREAFNHYISTIKNSTYANKLSYFEHNLETWRQLWRVLERSDIVVMVVDIRFAAFHFCLPLYKYIVDELKKPMTLVLNKIDAVPIENVVGWKNYFENNYPNLKVAIFTSYPKDPTNYQVKEGKVLKKNKFNKKKFASYGCLEIFECIQHLTGSNYDLSEWKQKIIYDKNQFSIDGDLEVEHFGNQMDNYINYCNYVTIGMVGYPNVGKSSVINALMGRKVVSISRTPGHTKYFQTIFLTKNVCLCDCPGIVFPSVIEKPLQILAGVYPIAQVQEPYTAVGYLAARADIPKLLQLKHPNDIENNQLDQENDESLDITNTKIYTITSSYQCYHPWSAWDICTSWAYKRGFMTAKSGRPDVYRAANNILKLSLEGKLNMYMLPKGFVENYENIRNDSLARKLKKDLMALYTKEN